MARRFRDLIMQAGDRGYLFLFIALAQLISVPFDLRSGRYGSAWMSGLVGLGFIVIFTMQHRSWKRQRRIAENEQKLTTAEKLFKSQQ